MITQRKHSRREMTSGARRTTNRTVSGIQASKRMACPRNNSTIRHSHRKMSSQLNNSMIPHSHRKTLIQKIGKWWNADKDYRSRGRHTHRPRSTDRRGAYTYHAYTTHVAEQQAEADRKQRQQSSVKAQNKWDRRKRKADDLVSTIKASPVAENSDVQKPWKPSRKQPQGIR